MNDSSSLLVAIRAIKAQALRDVADYLSGDHRYGWGDDVYVFPDTETMRPKVQILDWLRERADHIERGEQS